jgi:hypothetical protein
MAAGDRQRGQTRRPAADQRHVHALSGLRSCVQGGNGEEAVGLREGGDAAGALAERKGAQRDGSSADKQLERLMQQREAQTPAPVVARM